MRTDYDVVAFSEIEAWNRNGAGPRTILDTRLPRGRMKKTQSRKPTLGNPWNGGALPMVPL
jgi:hypothetical protein